MAERRLRKVLEILSTNNNTNQSKNLINNLEIQVNMNVSYHEYSATYRQLDQLIQNIQVIIKKEITNFNQVLKRNQYYPVSFDKQFEMIEKAQQKIEQMLPLLSNTQQNLYLDRLKALKIHFFISIQEIKKQMKKIKKPRTIKKNVEFLPVTLRRGNIGQYSIINQFKQQENDKQ